MSEGRKKKEDEESTILHLSSVKNNKNEKCNAVYINVEMDPALTRPTMLGCLDDRPKGGRTVTNLLVSIGTLFTRYAKMQKREI